METEQDGAYYTNTYDENGNDDGYDYNNDVAEEMGPVTTWKTRAASKVPGDSSTASASAPFNPFGKNTTPIKRKAEFGLEGVVKDMKTSPSPVKSLCFRASPLFRRAPVSPRNLDKLCYKFGKSHLNFIFCRPEFILLPS